MSSRSFYVTYCDSNYLDFTESLQTDKETEADEVFTIPHVSISTTTDAVSESPVPENQTSSAVGEKSIEPSADQLVSTPVSSGSSKKKRRRRHSSTETVVLIRDENDPAVAKSTEEETDVEPIIPMIQLNNEENDQEKVQGESFSNDTLKDGKRPKKRTTRKETKEKASEENKAEPTEVSSHQPTTPKFVANAMFKAKGHIDSLKQSIGPDFVSRIRKMEQFLDVKSPGSSVARVGSLYPSSWTDDMIKFYGDENKVDFDDVTLRRSLTGTNIFYLFAIFL